MENQEFTNPTITEISMLLQTSEISVLAVEGLTDQRFFENKVDTNLVLVYDCHGRDNVCKILGELESDFKNRIKGICDRDFLNFGIGSHKINGVYHTDYHDLEIDAITYSDLASIFTMLLSEEKMKNKGIIKTNAINLVLGLTNTIGHIRLINEMKNYNIDFEDYKLRKGVSYDDQFNSTVLGVLKSILRTKNNSHMLKDITRIESEIQTELAKSHDKKQISNGHDFTKCIIEFIKLFGVGKTSKIPDSNFIGNIILGIYTKSNLKKSKLGKSLKKIKYI